MKGLNIISVAAVAGLVLSCSSPEVNAAKEIIHDAEHYILKSQNSEKWAKADVDINKKLAALKAKHGTTPNIIYILWDDQQVGSVANEMFQKQLGYKTPNINQMAAEGINFTRMYSESSCTPTRAALPQYVMVWASLVCPTNPKV